MPANTHTTASGVFRLASRGKQNSTTIVVRLRTVNMYLLQPVTSCLTPACPGPCGLPPVGAQSGRLPVEVRVSPQPAGAFCRVVSVRLHFAPRLMAV